ncbi:MAG: AmmeMemoRadiSam system radical SAM enzyme, partial [Candidatus Firestonebacteria bacterium]
MKEALHWEKKGKAVHCLLCPHSCLLQEQMSGVCKVRKNIDGKLVSLIYGEVTSIALDPVEKKPLYHFYPGSRILSLGTNGCSFSCEFCQNWEISQIADTGRRRVTSAALVEKAIKEESIGIAYTYNEPFIWFEFVLETAKKVRKAGLKNVLVTNGYVNPKPLEEILPYIDAMNIDLKSFKESFYKNTCHGSLEPVKNTIVQSYKHCHIEITNLLIPGENDSTEELAELAGWIAGISTDIPLHVSAYFPQFKMKNPATTAAGVEKARIIYSKILKYVYTGNID